jgi:hypothetical protein
MERNSWGSVEGPRKKMRGHMFLSFKKTSFLRTIVADFLDMRKESDKEHSVDHIFRAVNQVNRVIHD